MEVSIQSLHFDADEKLLEFVEKKAKKLETFFDRLVSVDVTLRLEKTAQVSDKFVDLKVLVPGATLVSSESAKTFEEATDLSTEAMRRQIIKFKEKQRE
jgi:putative sigma-54 modulation protein